MTSARNHQLFFNQPTFYHLTSRCVRRAFLCGKDKFTGKCYDHRKTWLERRLFELSKWFYIDFYGYAILSNHYHLIVQTRPDLILKARDEQIALRWCRVFPQRDADEDQRVQALCQNKAKLNILRQRLGDISWLMRCLNEGLARAANKEDRCNGRFWQGRFHSQVLLDEAAVVTCMAYVDLNPMRAGIATTPESSEFTSIHYRIYNHVLSEPVRPLNPSRKTASSLFLNLKFSEYQVLVEQTGKLLSMDQPKANSGQIAPILERLNIRESAYSTAMTKLSGLFFRAIGNTRQLEKFSDILCQNWVKGRRSAAILFRETHY